MEILPLKDVSASNHPIQEDAAATSDLETPTSDNDPVSSVVIPAYMTDELEVTVEDEEDVEIIQVLAEDSVSTHSEPTDRIEMVVEGQSYLATTKRLYLQSIKAGNPTQSLISSLIAVVAEARDANSSCWGKVVKFEDNDGVTKTIFIENQDIISDSKSVLKRLSKEGLVLTSQKPMQDALVHYLNFAEPSLSVKATCTDRIGWHGKTYLFADNSCIGKGDSRYVYTGNVASSRTSVNGTIQEWKDNVGSQCAGNSLLVLAASVGFASTLLRLLNAESCGFHFYGESSTGKSTVTYVAASVSGDPEAMIIPWRTTTNGLEGKAKGCNDSLMVLDELHQSAPKDASDASYMLMNGKGKQRANVLGDAKDVADWKINCLSSGEVPMVSFLQEGGLSSRAGQEIRMLDISADMGLGLGAFENIHEAKDGQAFSEQLKEASSKYYGSAVREFLKQLTESDFSLKDDFETIRDRFFSDFIPDDADSQVTRVATKIAVTALAGEMATLMGITGWEEGEAYEAAGGTFTRWLEGRGTNGQQEHERAISQVQNFLLRNGMSNRFIAIEENTTGGYKISGPDRQSNNVAGFRVIGEGNVYEFLVLPEAYIKEMCLGMIPKNVNKTLIERGFLKPDKDGTAHRRYRLPGISQARVYHFTSSILSDADEFEQAEEDTEA